MLYTIENNEIADLKFMKLQIEKAQQHIERAEKALEACGDYDRYVALLETIGDLLISEDCLCDYFIKQKERIKN